MIPYLLVRIIAFYLLPMKIKGTGSVIFVMLVGIPMLCLATAILSCTYKLNSYDWRKVALFDFLLNYITLGIAVFIFFALLVVLIVKRRKLSKFQKTIVFVLLGIFAVYFAFVTMLVIGFESHPPREPVPYFFNN